MTTASTVRGIRDDSARRAAAAGDGREALAAVMSDVWDALEAIAAAIDERDRGRAGEGVSPTQLANELGHADGAKRVRAFLREPDDGGPAFHHEKHKHWRLGDEDADRVRRRFGGAAS